MAKKFRYKKKYFTTPLGVKISYEDIGSKKSQPIILIMGLGAQLTLWPFELCLELERRGYRVIRFDNRDCGKSTHFEQHGNPGVLRTWLKKRMNIKVQTPYQLRDMAQDVLHLMDGLKIKKAHIVGASMGGMIGQILAAKNKKRVLSFTSIMSSTSVPKLGGASFSLLVRIAKRPNPNNRTAAIEYNVKLNRLIGSPAYPVPEQELYQQAAANYEREGATTGFKRQLAAITAAKDRRQLVGKINAPTLVIHGDSDQLIPVVNGKDTAAQIRGSKLKIISGMGHNIPPKLAPRIAKLIAKHAKKSTKVAVAKNKM